RQRLSIGAGAFFCGTLSGLVAPGISSLRFGVYVPTLPAIQTMKLSLSFLLFSLLAAPPLLAQSPGDTPQEPGAATYCEVAASPAAYARQLVRITGFVTHGFAACWSFSVWNRSSRTPGMISITRQRRARMNPRAARSTAFGTFGQFWWDIPTESERLSPNSARPRKATGNGLLMTHSGWPLNL